MADASWSVQEAVFSVLSSALSVPVYDFVPLGAVFPYVTIGEGTVGDDSDKVGGGQEHSINVHAWSAYAGTKEAKLLLADVYAALHRQEFSILGHDLVLCHFDFASTVARDADGETYHGVHRYRIVTSPSS